MRPAQTVVQASLALLAGPKPAAHLNCHNDLRYFKKHTDVYLAPPM
jgi:hypothetical protein